MKLRALIILHPGFEEIEAVTPIDLLTRAGIEIVQTTISDDLLVTGRSGISLRATQKLSETTEDFDVTILPGGPGINKLRKHALICEQLRKQLESGGLIACICAAPLLLKDASLLEGVSYTAHPSIHKELKKAKKQAVVCDNQIITSEGAGTAMEFSLSIIARLCGEQRAREVANTVCWKR